jgi:hypothetical protein
MTDRIPGLATLAIHAGAQPHAFQKKTQRTARRDLELAAARLRQLKRESE